MPAEPQPVVRAAVPADAGPVAAIFAHYVATSVATFEEVAPTAADWRQRLGELAARNLPFLVAEAAAGRVAGWPGAAGLSAALPTLVRGGPSPPTGTRSRTPCTSLPAAPAAGSAAPCSELLAGCAAAGARQVIAVIADTGSDASAALHRRFGFTQAGLLSGVGRKHGRWIDTLLMQKELESGPTR